MEIETSKIGARGAFVIPLKFRQRFGFNDGSLVITEETEDGILIKPAVAFAAESYSKERKAEFLLSNAVDKNDYDKAREKVISMGLDPDKISHYRP